MSSRKNSASAMRAPAVTAYRSPIGEMMRRSEGTLDNRRDGNIRFGDSATDLHELHLLSSVKPPITTPQGEGRPMCEGCDHPIPTGRLKALKGGIPRRCLQCQERYDRKYPGNNDTYR